MMVMLFLLAALAVPTNQPDPPVSTAAEGPVEPARLAVARDLMKAMRLEQSYDEMFKDLAPIMASGTLGMLSANPDTKPLVDAISARGDDFQIRLMSLLSEEYLEAMRRRYPRMIELTAQEYARTFTLEELRTYVAFYAAPSGARMLQQQPALQMKLRSLGQAVGRDAGGEAAKRALERAEKEFGTAPGRSGT